MSSTTPKLRKKNMSKEFLKINFDPHTKTWKSVNYPYKDLTNCTVGEAFLQSMRSMEPTKILEYHYDERKEKQAKDIYQEAIIVAKNLQRLGIEKGDVVVLFSGNNSQTSALTFGAILMGAIVNFFEEQLENEDIVHMFEIIQPAVILYEDHYRDKVLKSLEHKKPITLKQIYSIDSAIAPNVASELLKSPGYLDYDKFVPAAIGNPQLEVAFLVLTSGSTGLLKAIQLTHCLLLNGVYVWWDNPLNHEPLNSNSILLSLSRLRGISQVEILLQSAILGVKRICSKREASGSYGLEILRETQPSHLFGVPSLFYNVLLELKEGDLESLKSLKYIQLGGEPPSHIIKSLTKKYALNSKLIISYGMSEVSCSITNDEELIGGKLQPGYEMQVLDDNFQPLGSNQHGKLVVKSPYPFVGYKGLDNTKYILENGFLLTGDYGYFDDDNILHLLARCKDLIIYQNIILIPNIVESLALRVPEIYITRLVGYHRSPEDPNEIGALFVVLKPNVNLSRNEVSRRIRDAWKGELSDDEILLIHDIYVLESLPLTPCGKIDRVVLKKQAFLMAEQPK